jgi:hypothetical protein
MNHKVGDKLTITFPIIGFSHLAESITLLMEPYAFNNRLDQALGDTNIISYEILDIWASKSQAMVTILITKLNEAANES